ncbi:MAG: sugar ABC transporter permease, partial [Syntrophobacteraceae bacterium]
MKEDKFFEVPFLVKARPYLIVMPALLLTLGILYPFVSAIYYSLTNYTMGRSSFKFVGFTNWASSFVDPDFWHAVLVTGEYASVTTGTEMLLGLGIALLLNHSSRYTNILKVVLV